MLVALGGFGLTTAGAGMEGIGLAGQVGYGFPGLTFNLNQLVDFQLGSGNRIAAILRDILLHHSPLEDGSGEGRDDGLLGDLLSYCGRVKDCLH